jgi:FtsH-binding integral membrane protein
LGGGVIAAGMRLACRWLVIVPSEARMLRIPRRFSHFVYGVIQSGLTCAIAAAIASVPFLAGGAFVAHWLQSWLVAWIMMLPVVLFAAPVIRNLTHFLTRED